MEDYLENVNQFHILKLPQYNPDFLYIAVLASIIKVKNLAYHGEYHKDAIK
jgi:hypothetical protein